MDYTINDLYSALDLITMFENGESIELKRNNRKEIEEMERLNEEKRKSN
jgi:hypothetical protein